MHARATAENDRIGGNMSRLLLVENDSTHVSSPPGCCTKPVDEILQPLTDEIAGLTIMIKALSDGQREVFEHLREIERRMHERGENVMWTHKKKGGEHD